MPFRLQLYHPIQLRLKMPSTTLKMLLNTNVIGHFQIYHVSLVLYSTLVPPTSAIVRGLNFSRSQPDLGVSLWVLRFSSLSKVDPQSKTFGLGAEFRDLA